MLCTIEMLAMSSCFAPASLSLFSSSIILKSLPHCAHMSFMSVGCGQSEDSVSNSQHSADAISSPLVLCKVTTLPSAVDLILVTYGRR
jgi:hypothetical protein